ncbi:MAG: SWIM zinc finger domain-containing protein [Anaerolineae bacterium]
MPTLSGAAACEIEGSSYEPYQVQITLNDAGIETTFCSCPYDWGGICKHLVATLLVLIHDGEKIEVKSEAIMDGGKAKYYDTAVSWLRDVRDIYQQHNRLAE